MMAAFAIPSSSWVTDCGDLPKEAATMLDTHPKQRSWVKRRKVRLTRQLHRFTNVLFPSPSGSRPSSQIRGAPKYRSPSPFPRPRLAANKVDEIEGQPEEPEGATWYDDLDELSRMASRASNASSMWRPPILYLDETRQSRSPTLPTSQAIQARREVKMITLSTTEAQPQSASIEQMPPAVVNDKTSLLADTKPLEVDNSREGEDVTAHDTTGIQDLSFCSLDEAPVLNPTRPLRYLGVSRDDVEFHSVSSHNSNTRLLSVCGWIQSSDYLSPLETSAPKKGWLPGPRHRYSEVPAVEEARPQDSLFPRQNNRSQSSIMSIPTSRQSLERLPSPAIPIFCPVPLHVPASKQDQPEPDDKKTKRWRGKSVFKMCTWLKM